MNLENKEMIESLYLAREEGLNQIIINRVKEIKSQKEYKEIEKIMVENKKIAEIFENYYNKKIGILIKEFYKEGFINGVNIILEATSHKH